jgi:hypothetical protein
MYADTMAARGSIGVERRLNFFSFCPFPFVHFLLRHPAPAIDHSRRIRLKNKTALEKTAAGTL